MPQLSEKIFQARTIIALAREDLQPTTGLLHDFERLEIAQRFGVVEELLDDALLLTRSHGRRRLRNSTALHCRQRSNKRAGFRMFNFLLSSLVLVIVLQFGELRYGFAASANYYATDQISHSYRIPITNPQDHTTISNVLVVTSAQLQSVMPNDSAVTAPRGFLFLTLQWSCGPVQLQYGDAMWGDFFSGITPLSASAITYHASNGRIYSVTRADPESQINNPNSSSDDGLVDATYYFTVPMSNRSGTVVIKPTHSTGTQFTDFVGGSPTDLTIGGPTRIPIQFPRHLTVVTPTTTTTTTTSVAYQPAAPSHSSSGLPKYVLVVGGLGVVAYLTRQRRRSAQRNPNPLQVPTRPTTPGGEPSTTESSPRTTTHLSVPEPLPDSPISTTAPLSTPSCGLRVIVFAGLAFEPVIRGLSDPARSLLCYLAFHRDRPLSAGEIQTALWPTSKTVKDVSRNTFHNYVTEARKAVGNVVLPEAARGAGYQLCNLTTDYDEFRDLVTLSESTDHSESVRLRREALSLVRGYPFASETAHYFEWIRSEGLESQIVRDVCDVALRTGVDLVREEDLDGAEDVLRVGLLVSPTSMELWEQLTDAIANRGGSSRLALHWAQAVTLLSATDVAKLRARLAS